MTEWTHLAMTWKATTVTNTTQVGNQAPVTAVTTTYTKRLYADGVEVRRARGPGCIAQQSACFGVRVVHLQVYPVRGRSSPLLHTEGHGSPVCSVEMASQSHVHARARIGMLL